MTKTAEDGTVAEWEKYEYNESNQLIAEELYNGKKTTKLAYAYDEDGNLISETGKIGTKKVQKSYEYDVENRLAAVYDGKQKNYELIEYINDVNREYTEVLVEQNINGKLDTAYVYGSASSTSDRLSLDRFDGSRGYYLYDPKGNVTGITNEEGQVYQSYRYGSFGEITFGAPQYENEYTYNGESYNPNIESQYLRARYYNVVNADFLTEDSYLGNIYEPLTLNRYNYCVSNPVNYRDPSGNAHVIDELGQERYFSPRSDDVSLPEAETSVYYEIAEEAMAPMNSFIMGFGVSEMKALLEIPTIVYYPGIMSESLFGIQNGPTQQMFNNYDAGVENMLMCLAGEVKDRTAFYAGRCFADATNTVLGAAVMSGGMGSTLAGAVSMVPEVASGAGVVALPASAAVVVEGAIITTVGVEITTQGMVSFIQDFSKCLESEASKDTTSGENSSEGDSGFKGDSETDKYYKKGLKEVPDDWIEVEAPEELKIKSESFKDFLREQGYNPENWRKVVEKWASPDRTIYQRNYWTNGTDYYYHGEGIEEFFPH